MIFVWNFLFSGFNIFASALFSALSNGIISALISFLRTFVFIIGAILLLPILLDVDGIWLAIPVAELFACLITTPLLLYGDINTNDPKWTCSFSNAVYHIGLPLKVCCQLDLLIVDGHEPIYPVGKLMTLIALAVRFYARKSMFNRPYFEKRLKCPAG